MSRTFTGSANGSFGQVDKPIVLQPPFTVAGHFKTSTPVRTPTGYLWWLGKKESSADWLAVTIQNGKMGIEARSLADNYALAFTANSVAANVGQHFVATFADTDSREIILNDLPASKGTSTAERTPATPNRTCIGRAGRSAPTGGWIGELAYLAVWNRVLTADEKSALAKGANPQSISGLVEYHELDGDDNPEPGVLGIDIVFAMTGSPKGTFNPTIQPYSPRSDGLPFDPANLIAGAAYKWASFSQTFGFVQPGHVWTGETQTFVDPTTGNTIDPRTGMTEFHAEAKAAARAIMAYLNTLGWSFTEVAPGANPEVTFAFTPAANVYQGGVNGFAYYPTTGAEGSVWLRPDKTAETANLSLYYSAGGRRYLTLLHEVYHVLGFRHATAPEASRSNSVMSVSPPIEDTGGEPYASVLFPVDLAAMKLVYPTLGLPAQATAVTKHGAGGAIIGKRLVTRAPTIAFDDLWTIPFTSGRKLMIAVAVTPESLNTSFTGLTFGGVAGTFKGSNGWTGSNDAELLAFYEFSAWPATASQVAVTCDKNLWSGTAFYWTYSGQGSTYLIGGFADNASINYVQFVTSTEPGSLILAVGTAQGNDMAPVGLVWTGGVLDAQGVSSSTSTSTDHAMGAASKIVTSGTSETPRFTFPLSDGRGILVCSIPPEVSSGPPPVGAGAGAVISVGDVDYTNLQPGTNAKVVVLLVEIDRAANKLRVQMDDGSVVEQPWTGTENDPTGQVIIGAGIQAGAVQNGSNQKILGVFGSTDLQGANAKGVIHGWAAQKFRPVLVPFDAELLIGSVHTLNLTPSVKDPGQWGWEILDVDRPNSGTAVILDDHRLSLDLTGVTAGLIAFQVQIQSLHPLAPSATMQIRITAKSGEITVPDKEATVVEDGTVLIDPLAGTGFTLTSIEDPENGTTSVESNRVRYIPDAGFFGLDTFTYTARDSNGVTGTGTISVTVTEKGVTTSPVPDFTWDVDEGAAPLTVKLTYTGTIHDEMEFLWDGGGTNVSNAQDVEFTFYSAGDKSVSLKVTVPGFSPVTISKTSIIKVTSGGTSPPPPPPAPLGTIEIGTGTVSSTLPVLWEHSPTSSDVTIHGLLTGSNREDWLEAYIRDKWKGKGSVSMLVGHIPNTLATTILTKAPDGTTPCYRMRHRRYKALGDSDPKQWRGSQIGVPWKQNGGTEEAVTEFRYWIDDNFNNYLDSASQNPSQIIAPGKIFWLFWGGPWRGSTVDSISPASGGTTPDQQNDWSIRATWTGSKADKGTKLKWKGYMYILEREPGSDPTVKEFGMGTTVSPEIIKGQWNTIKAYVKLNTYSGSTYQSNGIVRLWHNDVMFYNRTDLNIRSANDWPIQGCGPCHFWGGDPQKAYMLSQKQQDVWMTDFKMGGK